MKEFVISEVKAETAVLVGLITPQQNEAKTKEYLDELEWMYNNLDNTTNYSLYVTRNTLRAVLNKDAPNLKLKIGIIDQTTMMLKIAFITPLN